MLGARPATSPEGEQGYRFAVWAPRVQSVSVVGDFNGWDSNAVSYTHLDVYKRQDMLYRASISSAGRLVFGGSMSEPLKRRPSCPGNW